MCLYKQNVSPSHAFYCVGQECAIFHQTKSALIFDPHWQQFHHIVALRSNKKVTITNEYCYIYCGILYIDNNIYHMFNLYDISYMEMQSDNGSFACFLPLFPPCVDIVILLVTSVTIHWLLFNINLAVFQLVSLLVQDYK